MKSFVYVISLFLSIFIFTGSTFEYAHDGLDFTTAILNIKIPGEERPLAPGAFRPDLVDPEVEITGLTWGISMVHNGDESYLVRWKTVKGK